MILILYFVIVLVLLIWMIVSRNEELDDMTEPDNAGIQLVFYKMAKWLCRNIEANFKSIRTYQVRRDLRILKPHVSMDKVENEYYIKKISLCIMIFTCAWFLAMVSYITARQESVVQNGSVVQREDYGEGEKELLLTANFDNGETEDFEITLDEKAYTEKEVNEMLPEFTNAITSKILGSNKSLDHVDHDLELIEEIEGYPFDIKWKIDSYNRMNSDGSIVTENIPESGDVVMLTAVITYGRYEFEHVFYAHVYNRVLTAAEKRRTTITSQIAKVNEQYRDKTEVKLPDTYENVGMYWSSKIDDKSLVLLVLGIITSIMIYIFKDKELRQELMQRENELMLDYPKFVSKLVLYMGAGMTVRNIFLKLSNDYKKDLKKGEPKRFLYEEIVRSCHQLESGISEMDVYEQFGIRCTNQSYTRLATLLSQNLKKGNSELLNLLQEESEKAFAERMDRARKLGEEAGTKLLLPMIIMLMIIMVIVMIPAYMSF